MPTPGGRFAMRTALLLACALAWGCLVSSQRVQLACLPEEVEIYVDGRLLEEDFAVLRTDEPHKIFVKGAGYAPRLVVLEPTPDAEGGATLGPDEVCIEVVPIGVRRELELEVEHDAPG